MGLKPKEKRIGNQPARPKSRSLNKWFWNLFNWIARGYEAGGVCES